ncbi:MAG: ABC transporter permease [Candidatus Omnitrophica bacterium]|nr:ABC transporter permease [Candidatus Omnitrophota bacterium]MDD5672099.1 ABC transporter permease [Candidatus Omnitrophota bacterium]
MTLLIGSVTIGLILSLLALGVYISFRIFDFPDITADGSITLGAAVTAILLVQQVNPLMATLAGAGAGCVAGTVTGILHTRFKIHGLLSGILVMTALYSLNLHIMGRSNIPLLSVRTLSDVAEQWSLRRFGEIPTVNLFGWEVMARDMAVLAFMFLMVTGLCWGLYIFLKTNLGTAMRATGDNPQMIRALGVNTEGMIVLGLALSNGLIAFSGSLLAQYQGFSDVQMGIGMVVWGLASVIIGESLVQTRKVGLTIAGVVMGSILFRLLVAIALRLGLNPNDLKLITAVFVFAALIVPGLLGRFKKRKSEVPHA